MEPKDIRQVSLKFASGASIPVLGFGAGTAWYLGPEGNSDGHAVNRPFVDSIKTAFKLGFTHLDNALMYGNEEDAGVAIKEYLAESGKKREDIFVTTKVWTEEIADIPASLRGSLKRLGLDYVDLFLIHAPFFGSVGLAGKVTVASAWKQMEQVKDAGLAKEIGVSNFRVSDFDEIFASKPKYTPAINQLECNPYLPQTELLAYHASHGILTASYSPLLPLVKPLGSLPSILADIAKSHGATTGQVLLAWNLAKRNVVITTSSREERLKEYLDVGKVELTEEEVGRIDEAGKETPYREYWTDPGEFEPLKK
ncbi:2,5-diketo-D-gluconate reductase-like protein A [Gonapodya prolifera JEL478]|uniref:2,5-diketo-D-gluconate reductase-like protein A n=1 Tax=Gonapodya prolifera (strain JEL478) TaxID=1344416 RepID=A0A139A224_GONPJ|nr:2,5-diketo-D-gluconate reductase-like protein A [Gonapodya prolifera JEL478]|eukprot:KXS10739.1 2,5-diketo-D-gluconate reductase-like protein A [Gonapodya prolifera JEL478]